MGFEIRPCIIQPFPPSAPFHDTFQFTEPLERYRNRELHPLRIEHFHLFVAEKGPIKARFQFHRWQYRPYVPDPVANEFNGTIGVMDISWAVIHVEYLPGLCDRAEERIVAALPSLALVVSHRTAFSTSSGAEHRTVTVHCDTLRLKLAKRLQDQ